MLPFSILVEVQSQPKLSIFSLLILYIQEYHHLYL